MGRLHKYQVLLVLRRVLRHTLLPRWRKQCINCANQHNAKNDWLLLLTAGCDWQMCLKVSLDIAGTELSNLICHGSLCHDLWISGVTSHFAPPPSPAGNIVRSLHLHWHICRVAGCRGPEAQLLWCIPPKSKKLQNGSPLCSEKIF